MEYLILLLIFIAPIIFGIRQQGKIANKTVTKAVTKPKPRRNNGWRYRSGIENVTVVSLPAADPLVIPEGEYEQKVFTYDGRPLKGKRKGSRFMLDVVPGFHTMESIYTGTEWTSSTCVAYMRQLVGHIGESAYERRILMLMEVYPYVRVHARRDGTDSGGWPYIVLLLPSFSWFDEALENADKGGDAASDV